LPLLERVRVEVYLPDLPSSEYQNLLRSFEEEFTHAFGGCSTVKGIAGSYLSETGERIPDRINLIYSDMPLALSTNFESVAGYASELKRAAMQVLSEESVFVSVQQVITRSSRSSAMSSHRCGRSHAVR
jgi:hypothetical protein